MEASARSTSAASFQRRPGLVHEVKAVYLMAHQKKNKDGERAVVEKHHWQPAMVGKGVQT